MIETAGIEDAIGRSIRHTCRELGVKVHAIGMVPDHVHLVCSIPPRHAPSEVVRQIKAYSSRLVNDAGLLDARRVFYWQPEFGYFTFAERSLDRISAYALNQKEHHRNGTILADLERIDTIDR